MRRPHYLPHNKGNQIPSECIWFDTETVPEINTRKEEIHHLDFGYAVYRRRRNDLHWCAPEWIRFTSIDEFWDWVISKTRKKTRLHLFSHNGGFDLPVVNAFEQLPGRGYQLKSAVVDAPPMICTWKGSDRSIRFIDTLNIWRVSLKKLGDSIGLPKLSMPKPEASRDDWNSYGKRDVEIICEATINWFKFLRENDLGGFSPTLASQAFNAYRHRFMKRSIFIDDKTQSLELARESYLGGRTECFRLGSFTGEYYYLDINSMYPYVMKDRKYPRQLIALYKHFTIKDIESCIDENSLVAEVWLDTKLPIYPILFDGKLIFPIGKFRAVLTTPELRYALEHNHIKKIGKIAVYEQSELFSQFVTWTHDQRCQAKDANNDIASYFLKIFMNSLYGKFGQRGRVYEEIEQTYDMDVKAWTDITYPEGIVTHFRQFGGIIQAFKDEGESTHSFPAIAAHVTAEARMELWELMNEAGRKNVFYCDTDSILVNAEGYQKVAHRIQGDALGALKVEEKITTFTLYGAKDYKINGRQKTKGIRKDAEWIDEDKVNQLRFIGFKGLLQRGSIDAPVIHKHIKKLSRIYTKGIVDQSGFITPVTLCDW